MTGVPAIGAPTLTSAHYVNTGVSLSFTGPTLPSGLTVTRYNFQLSTNGGATVTYGSSVAASTSPLIVPGSYCYDLTTCSYRIQTAVGEWVSPWSNWISAPAIGAPTLVSASYVDTGVSLSFTQPALLTNATPTRSRLRGVDRRRDNHLPGYLVLIFGCHQPDRREHVVSTR